MELTRGGQLCPRCQHCSSPTCTRPLTPAFILPPPFCDLLPPPSPCDLLLPPSGYLYLLFSISFTFLLALPIAPTYASLSGSGISPYLPLSSCVSFFIPSHECLGSLMFFPFSSTPTPILSSFALGIVSHTLILKSTISVFWYFFDYWDFLWLSSLHMMLFPPPLPPSKAKWTASMDADDMSQPLAWNAPYTLFQSALPIMSDAWWRLALAWAWCSTLELKNGFSFFIFTRDTEQGLSWIPWLGSSAPGSNRNEWRIFICLPQRE